jgi:hypothetical protein
VTWFGRRTRHVGGGLLGVGIADGGESLLCQPSGWVPPAWIDSRGYCLATDDQGATSMCAAYSAAGLVEVVEWRRSGVPKTVNPLPIYAEAKRLDGNDQPGTTLQHAVEAVRNLALFSDLTPFTTTRLSSFRDCIFAMHRQAVCLLGFEIDAGWNKANTATGWIAEGGDRLGGHAVLGCWASVEDGIGFQNSWGRDWGVQGFGRMTRGQFDRSFLGGMAVDWPSPR